MLRRVDERPAFDCVEFFVPKRRNEGTQAVNCLATFIWSLRDKKRLWHRFTFTIPCHCLTPTRTEDEDDDEYEYEYDKRGTRSPRS